MNRKHRKVVVVVIILAGLLSLIIFSNFKSNLVRQLQGPIEGTDSVITVGDKLSVISKENHVFTWQWKDLSIWPVVAKPASNVVTTIADDRMIYATAGIGKLVITDLKADKELLSLSLPYGAECKKIKTSSNGKFGAVSMLVDGKDWLKLAVFDSNLMDLFFVFQNDAKEENFSLDDFDITNNGNLITGVGRKEKAWAFVKDVKSEKILWEKTFDEYGRFTCAEFSPDGKTIYIAEKVRFIIALDAITGNILRTYEIPQYNTPTHQKQNISSIAISPDGKILAADTEPARIVWFWGWAADKEIGKIYASDLTVSGIAFSPDSKYLATGCLVAPEIKIWKVPQLNK
ncbi:MAG: WD40 repeat domain-containing protein [Phycisphaerae bacterium]|jgi:WD40 repeat protein